MSVLTINGLTKQYGKVTAVDGLHLSVERGEVYGILGPNGSGKTTTLAMVLGVTAATSGDFSWFGEGSSNHKVRRRIGALLETPNFYPYLDGLENLRLVAHLKGATAQSIGGLLEMVNLSERARSKFSTYSLGMKQRLAIAGAMVGDPEVLIFDEPTNGLDPQGIAEVRQTLLTVAAMGKTIFMASHILDEVERVCSHVAIIKGGKLLAAGTVGAILSNDWVVELGASDLAAVESFASALPHLRRLERSGQLVRVTMSSEPDGATINRLAFEKGLVLTHLAVRRMSLESEFLKITQ